MKPPSAEPGNSKSIDRTIKCVVWDLDQTLWNGILLEDVEVSLKEGVREIIDTLDQRGILHSIASRNDYAVVMRKLEDLDLHEYFLYPQINWNAKAASLETIANAINIGMNTMAFVDDDPFELDQVRTTHPQVLVIDAAEMDQLPAMPAFDPPGVTEESRMRRQLYRSEMQRREEEESFVGPAEEFMATLGMTLTISPAGAGDLLRAEELTIRTNQLNTTGRTYSMAELERLRGSSEHQLLVAELEDRYGSYGKIGLVLMELADRTWTIKLFLMSCRVMSRGVGTIILNYLMERARREGVRLRAEFIPTGVNRMVYVALKFAGFKETARVDDVIVLETDLDRIQPCPAYVQLVAP